MRTLITLAVVGIAILLTSGCGQKVVETSMVETAAEEQAPTKRWSGYFLIDETVSPPWVGFVHDVGNNAIYGLGSPETLEPQAEKIWTVEGVSYAVPEGIAYKGTRFFYDGDDIYFILETKLSVEDAEWLVPSMEMDLVHSGMDVYRHNFSGHPNAEIRRITLDKQVFCIGSDASCAELDRLAGEYLDD